MKSDELKSRIGEIKEVVCKIMNGALDKKKSPEIINKATSLMVDLYELDRISEHILPIGEDKQKTLQNKIYRRLKEALKKADELLTPESIDDVRYMIRSYMRLI